MGELPKISFPKIKRVVIEYFTLYRLVDKIQVDLKDGVFCLAGANGLGKSTFISILHYGFTGVVINPRKNFASINQVSKFFNENKNFADEYFDGRVEEKDRGRACVTIQFSVGEFEYTIKRNFFELDALQEFTKVDANAEVVVESGSKLPNELNTLYQQNLKTDLKFETFEQFAFLFYFLFTFDESRKLLFWDISILSRILHLVFGTDSAKAERSDLLKKEVARHESNMRNMQFAIQKDEKTLAGFIRQLSQTQVSRPENADTILEEYETMTNQLSEILSNINKADKDLKECSLKLADYSLKLTTLKKSYDDVFQQQFQSQPIERDARVIDLLKELEKAISKGEDGLSQFEKLKNIIQENSAKIALMNNPAVLQSLKEIDEKLHGVKEELNETNLRKLRVEGEKTILNQQLLTCQEKLQKIETDSKDILEKFSKTPETENLHNIIKSFESTIAEKKKDKAIEEQKRNVLQAELGGIDKELSVQYALVEEEFIPIFSSYANSFLGIEVGVKSERTKDGFSLSLSVGNTGRSENYQLSESQRYFIDIALRMALVEYWCSSGTIMIDTPEGSLDIAYESKAGKMFAGFALKGFDIIMTANINSSQLLIQMALACKSAKMKLGKMTDWTTLSQVQQDEKKIIDAAFSEIEEKLTT